MERINRIDRLEAEMLKRRMLAEPEDLREAGIVGQVAKGLAAPIGAAAGATALGYGAAMVGKRIADRTRAFRATVARNMRLMKSSLYANTVKRFFNKFDGRIENLSGETCQALAKLWGGGITAEAIPEAVKEIKVGIWAVFNAQLASNALLEYLNENARGKTELASMARESLQAYRDGTSAMFKYESDSFINTGYGRTVFGLSNMVKPVSDGYARLIAEKNFGILFPHFLPMAVFIANPALAQSLTAAFKKGTDEDLAAYLDAKEKAEQANPEPEQKAGQTPQKPNPATAAQNRPAPEPPAADQRQADNEGWDEQYHRRRPNHAFLKELAVLRFVERVSLFLREMDPSMVSTAARSAQAADERQDEADYDAERAEGDEPEGTSRDEIEAAYKAWQEVPFAKHPVVLRNMDLLKKYVHRPVDMIYLLGASLMKRGLLDRSGVIADPESFSKFIANISMALLQSEFEAAKADWKSQKYQAADDDKSNKQRRKGIRGGAQ